ncbi:MAG: phage integrase N-terminal SAM-like domain-containing protein, partial [Chitinivibrionales bacterium]|nr:phage integrase N-terminal SAM-like domain-containing protein [Chitinivibrionales bacterium]
MWSTLSLSPNLCSLSLFSIGNMSPERTALINRLKLKGDADKTIDSYLQALDKASKFHKKPPQKMTGEEIEAFFLHELEVEKMLPSSI